MKLLNPIIQIFFISMFLLSCEKDIAVNTEEKDLQPLSEIKLYIDSNTRKAQIRGNTLSNTQIQLKNKGKLGGIIAKINQKDMGIFQFNIDLLPDFEQNIELVATRNKKNYTYDLKPIPSYAYGLDKKTNEIKELLTKGKWRSNQLKSRIIIKQSNPSPPYDIFVTVAQKIFDFNENNNFIFEVISPLKFIHNAGTWNITTNSILNIETQIPLGPMKISNGKILELNETTLSILVNISDGVFIIYLDKEES